MFSNSLNLKVLYFKFFVITSVLMPLFPSLLNRSQVHINMYMALLSIITFFLFRFNFNNERFFRILTFYTTLQLLLLLSYLFGVESPSGLGDVMSLVRPFLLFILTGAFYVISFNEPKVFYVELSKVLSVLVITSIAIGIIELVRPPVLIDLIFFFFKMSDKLDIVNSSVGFFSLPYYNAFFYISSIIVILFVSLHTRFDYLSVFSLFCGVLGVFLTQSKTGVLALVLILFFSIFLKLSRLYKFLFFICFGLLFIFISQFLGEMLIYLNEHYSGNLIRTSYNIYHNQEDTNTLGVRILQVSETFNLILNGNIFWGLGLGKDVLLESWLSTSLYRYGIFGTILLFIVPSYIVLKLLLKANMGNRHFNRLNESKDYLIYIFPVWLSSCFFTQLSALMIEVSKGALIGCLMIGIGISYSSYYFGRVVNRSLNEKSVVC